MTLGSDLFGGLVGGPQMMLALLVFLAAATLTFSVMAGARVRSQVRRRAASISGRAEQDKQNEGARSLRGSSIKAAERLLDYTTKHYATADTKDMKVLRRRLVQ